MRHYKLPFNIHLENKFNDINIDQFIDEWNNEKNQRKAKQVTLMNDLAIELGKFKVFDISISEIIDLGMRYALGKQEFRKMAAMFIELKSKK